ncbi:hypothetical protein L484_021985 [Morus notabilis]|uniref:Uncharacterized protein n=1 Tax=Morus notabilis TaxID=981085 RepID=W9QML3_9ROSA|nr:hypothetical protein L484_021985 [Morus notabilis]
MLVRPVQTALQADLELVRHGHDRPGQTGLQVDLDLVGLRPDWNGQTCLLDLVGLEPNRPGQMGLLDLIGLVKRLYRWTWSWSNASPVRTALQADLELLYSNTYTVRNEFLALFCSGLNTARDRSLALFYSSLSTVRDESLLGPNGARKMYSAQNPVVAWSGAQSSAQPRVWSGLGPGPRRVLGLGLHYGSAEARLGVWSGAWLGLGRAWPGAWSGAQLGAGIRLIRCLAGTRHGAWSGARNGAWSGAPPRAWSGARSSAQPGAWSGLSLRPGRVLNNGPR